eukprot:6527980-Karenia_brevis.AAC.1
MHGVDLPLCDVRSMQSAVAHALIFCGANGSMVAAAIDAVLSTFQNCPKTVPCALAPGNWNN